MMNLGSFFFFFVGGVEPNFELHASLKSVVVGEGWRRSEEVGVIEIWEHERGEPS